jgi:hypothetical protein
MRNDPHSEIRERLRRTFELIGLAEAMMLQNLRRRFPLDSEEQIEARIVAWLQERPEAKHGDASGPFQLRVKPL